MTDVDVEKLLSEVSPDAPCGEDLEYDPAFGELERAAQGKPEQEMGDTKIEAQPPDWRTVETKALELFPRTKDLRVAVPLAKALLHSGGFGGFGSGLEVVHGLLERFWDQVHPRLDPADDNDPVMRINALGGLADTSEFLPALRLVPLVNAPGFGKFGFRQVEVAWGERQPPAGTSAPEPATIEGAFASAPLEEVRAVAQGVARSLENLAAIDKAVTERAGPAQSPNLDELARILTKIDKFLGEQLAKRGTEGAAAAAEASPQPTLAGAAPAKPSPAKPSPDGAAAPAGGGLGQIHGTDDVIRAFEAICDYYELNEPSSPVPLLVKRARRLVSKDFMEIVRDLAPESVKQLDKICGNDSE